MLAKRALIDLCPEMNNPEAVVRTERVLPYSPQEVFQAFQQPEQLAKWWGPHGFSNTFQQFEFRTGGPWVLVMHGPNGANYFNESFFEEVQLKEKIVVRHVSQPPFTLTITLNAREEGTHLTWVQEFDSIEVATNMRRISPSPNEENLDRLEAVLSAGPG